MTKQHTGRIRYQKRLAPLSPISHHYVISPPVLQAEFFDSSIPESPKKTWWEEIEVVDECYHDDHERYGSPCPGCGTLQT